MQDQKKTQKDAPRRAWTGRAVLAAALLLVPGVLAGVSTPVTEPLLAQAAALPGPTQRYRDHELQVMDPHEYRERLDTGEAELTLRGVTYRVQVARDPWGQEAHVARVLPDGRVERHELAFKPALYSGRVVGEPGSDVTIVVTSLGVLAHVDLANESLRVEPLAFSERLAPPGVSVVYRLHDVKHEAYTPLHGPQWGTALTGEDPAEGDGSMDLGIASYRPGIDRRLALFVDAEMTQVPGYEAIFLAEYAVVAKAWFREIGFRLEHMNQAVYFCDLCASNDGGTLLGQLADMASQGNMPWTGHHVALLYTGKMPPGMGGAAWQPGKQAFVRGNDPNTDSMWRTLAFAHEIGHSFGARHEFGQVYEHHHKSDWLWYTHHTIMTGASGSRVEGHLHFTGQNANWIRSCNAHGWDQGTRNAASMHTFGPQCGYIRFQNHGLTQFDATLMRGKVFTDVPRSTIVGICIYSQTPNQVATLAVKQSPDGTLPVFTVDITVQHVGWNCARPGAVPWTSSTMFVYKIAGAADIAYDTQAPHDGRGSADNGQTWYVEGSRRAIYVDVARSHLVRDGCTTAGRNANLAPDTSLPVGGSLQSCNGVYSLVHQGDGNVVLYNGSKVDWASNTGGSGTQFIMQGDGNLVLYGNGVPIWATHTGNNPGAWLQLRDDGRLIVYAPAGHTLWSAGCGRLDANRSILVHQHVKSCDQRFTLAHQGDGNVVLYDGTIPIWATNTPGYATTEFKMQGDGNLVLYGPGGSVPWAAHTWGSPGNWLSVEQSGRLIMWSAWGEVVWQRP